MGKTVSQLVNEAKKLMEQAKELEKQQYSKIGQFVAKLHNEGKLKDQDISAFIEKTLGKTEPQKAESLKAT